MWNDSVRRTGVLAMGYSAIAVVILWPLCNYGHLGSALYRGDVRLVAWVLAWNNHALLDGVPSLFDANVFYPAKGTLVFNEHLFGISLFTLPIYALTRNAALAYNVVWLCSFPASALAAHWLAWRYTRDHVASLLAGAIYAFSFFKILQGGGNLKMVWAFWLPLALLFLAWWFDRPRWTTIAAFGVAVTLQVLSSWYVGVLLIVAVVPLFAWRALALMRRAGSAEAPPRAWARRAAQVAVVLGLSAAAIWPFVRPYTGGTMASSRADIRENTARLGDYLLPPAHTWEGHVFARAGVAGLHPHYGERALFVGYVALAAAVVGGIALLAVGIGRRSRPAVARGTPFERTATMVRIARTGEIWCVVVAGAFAFVCSLGPAAPGPEAADWTLFAWFASVPGMAMFRSPARFALLVMLAVGQLAACGAAWWQARWGARGRALTVALLALGSSESFLVGSPLGRPAPAPIPPIYHHLAAIPARAIVSLPGYRAPEEWWLRADYQYYSTAHWHPIVNGYGRAEPPDHFWIMGHMTAFPGPNSARTMRRLGVEYVVLHADRYPDGAAAILAEAGTSADFALVRRIGDAYLYRVQPQPQPQPPSQSPPATGAR